MSSPLAPTPELMSSYLVGRPADFSDGEGKVFVLDGHEVGVYRCGDGFRAYENVCPHAGGPVCEGLVLGKVEPVIDEAGMIRGERFSEDEIHIVCPWHAFEFDIEDGRCMSDRRMRLRSYEVTVADGEIRVVV
jgi:nitrite reductase (NADH) small subunit